MAVTIGKLAADFERVAHEQFGMALVIDDGTARMPALYDESLDPALLQPEIATSARYGNFPAFRSTVLLQQR